MSYLTSIPEGVAHSILYLLRWMAGDRTLMEYTARRFLGHVRGCLHLPKKNSPNLRRARAVHLRSFAEGVRRCGPRLPHTWTCVLTQRLGDEFFAPDPRHESSSSESLVLERQPPSWLESGSPYLVCWPYSSQCTTKFLSKLSSLRTGHGG
jgi:hypothetical protein